MLENFSQECLVGVESIEWHIYTTASVWSNEFRFLRICFLPQYKATVLVWPLTCLSCSHEYICFTGQIMFCLLIKDSLFFLPTYVITIQKMEGMQSKCRNKIWILTSKRQSLADVLLCDLSFHSGILYVTELFTWLRSKNSAPKHIQSVQNNKQNKANDFVLTCTYRST